MVNYVLSFCKITAASRLFSRNFYLPLLKPQTPKDALRTFKITGKWLLGGKTQHYMPVLLNHKKKRSTRSKNFGHKTHKLSNNDYAYMVPILDGDTNDNHKLLLKILNDKNGAKVKNGGTRYIYTVEDRKYYIVIEPQLECAILDGDVIDILVSQRNDKIIVKLKNMKKIPMELQQCDEFNDDEYHTKQLYCGEGTTTPEEEKFHHHGKYTMSLARMFEEKEMQEEKWEQELKRIIRRRKRQAAERTKEWRTMIKETIRNLGKRFEVEAKRVIDEISEPATEETMAMDIDDLNSTKEVNETFLTGGADLMNQLPTIREIPDIIRNMGTATTCEISAQEETSDGRLVSGVKVTLPSGRECFVSGQMVHTEDGDVFVPGQTVENQYGMEYTPGITINVDNKPTLISGLILGDEEKDAVFLPTQSTITSDGQLTFATVPEERPSIQRVKPPKQSAIVEESCDQSTHEDEHLNTTKIESDNDEDDPLTEPSQELNTEELQELQELDIEAIRLKHEQQQQELQKLKLILLDDGMDELIASLEEKKARLQRKLDEMRRLSLMRECTLVSYISDSDTAQVASTISNDQETIDRLSDVLMMLIRRTATLRDRNSIQADNLHHPHIAVTHPSEADIKFTDATNKMKFLLKSAVITANDVFKSRPKDQMLALHAVGEIIADVLRNDPITLTNLLHLMQTANDRVEVFNAIYRQLVQNIADTKVAKLHNLAKHCNDDCDAFYTNVEKILNGGNELTADVFVKLAKLNPKLLATVAQILSPQISKIQTEQQAEEALLAAVVAAVKQQMHTNLQETLTDEEFTNSLLDTAIYFAKALGLDTIEEELHMQLSLNNNGQPRRFSECSIEFLTRITMILQLAEREYTLKTSIERLRKCPERARNDPRIRQLIRGSAVLLERKPPLHTSRDVDVAMIKSQNLLAIEDFLMRRNQTSADLPVLISRGNYQAVVPKEAARGVLAGRVPFMLIDENGISTFKPTHMFTGTSLGTTNLSQSNRDALAARGGRRESSDIGSSVPNDVNDGYKSSTYLRNKSRGTYGGGRNMTSRALYRGVAGPRA